MRNTNEYSRVMKESSNAMICNTVFNKSVFNNTRRKLKTIIAIGALISLAACTGYTPHSSEVGLVIPTYPVIQF